jgi:hypothetical protein
LYNFRKKGLFLGGQNVISWGGGAQGGTGGGNLPPPACMLKNLKFKLHIVHYPAMLKIYNLKTLSEINIIPTYFMDFLISSRIYLYK